MTKNQQSPLLSDQHSYRAASDHYNDAHVLLFNHSRAKIKLMKTKLRYSLFFTLLSIVLPVYAEQVPIVILDSEACQIKGWHNLGGCFQNATGAKLVNANLYLKQTITYSDKRAPIVGSFALNNFHADHYAITSSSSEVFTGHHIKFVTSELALGSGTAGKPINGCKIFLSGEHAVIRMRLIKSGEELSCTTN